MTQGNPVSRESCPGLGETQCDREVRFLRKPATTIRRARSVITPHSERTLLLGTVLIVSAASLALSYLFERLFSVDVLSSLLMSPPEDCWVHWGEAVGRHCFSDYAVIVQAGMWPNPWDHPVSMPAGYSPMWTTYPAAAMTPQLLFGVPAVRLGVPVLGLLSYLFAMTVAVLTPAIWAARGTSGLERIVVFVTLSAVAVPVWAVIDRGNSTGFVVPIALAFLVALRRQRWGLAAIMVLLAAFVKPQFAVLVVALLAARQWRLGGLAFGGVVITNLAAYLLWPRDFPQTITQSIHNFFSAASPLEHLSGQGNVSFGKALLIIPDTAEFFATGGKIPDGFLTGPRVLAGYVVLVIVVGLLLALGRRTPPVLVGVVLLATAALFPAKTSFYYLVFALPVAAVIVRDPSGPPGTGIFDGLAAHGGRRRAVGFWVTLAAALSIAHLPLSQPGAAPIPGHNGATRLIVLTTIGWAPILWLIACAVIIGSYARRRATESDPEAAGGSPPNTIVRASAHTAEPPRGSSTAALD